MHRDNYNLTRQKLERLLQQDVESSVPNQEGTQTWVEKAWYQLQNRWKGAIASLTQDSKIFNQPSHVNGQSGDFSYWYNFSWQAWVYSRLEDNPEEGRGWLEQVYRRSK